MRRDTREKLIVDWVKVVEVTNSILLEIQKSILSKANEFLRENTLRAVNLQELKSILVNKGGFVVAGWCGREECELKIKEETGADIRVLPIRPMDKPSTCVYCGLESKKTAIFARAY